MFNDKFKKNNKKREKNIPWINFQINILASDKFDK